ncbi:hypothetical protein BKA63DRAFT_161453 [Paraphoma chrysanthemicola]|nr:hypothetical protein BKA63DRAFT_161453 [Paraphoma chrysanthemicola]
METYGTHALVREFITCCPDKIEDVLVKCCEDKKWQTEITTCLLRARVGQHASAPASPPGGFSITLGNTAPISSVDSVHSMSPPPRQRMTRQASSSTRHYPTPLSPPSTASSTTSRSVKNEAATGEYIFLIALNENEIQEQPVRMKTAQIRDSVIREEVVHERDLASHLTQIDQHQVAVPSITTPGSYLTASVYECITLTWRRHNSNKTHNTTFYVLPRSDMSADILLGFQDSGEYGAGMFLVARTQCTAFRD